METKTEESDFLLKEWLKLSDELVAAETVFKAKEAEVLKLCWKFCEAAVKKYNTSNPQPLFRITKFSITSYVSDRATVWLVLELVNSKGHTPSEVFMTDADSKIVTLQEGVNSALGSMGAPFSAHLFFPCSYFSGGQ